jgi:hypothetical protein
MRSVHWSAVIGPCKKEEILAEIKRTAEENGGKPLGRARIERVTGITIYDWSRYWARFSEAQRETGFEATDLGMRNETKQLYCVERLRALAPQTPLHRESMRAHAPYMCMSAARDGRLTTG